MSNQATYLPGVYADSTFGHDHCREVLADILRDVGGPGDIARSLESETWPDDHWDEDEALDWLNDHVQLAGHFWGFVDGDLGLWPNETW